jgi:hypothetical protein
MPTATPLREVLASIRSKNAGPFAFTVDIFFKTVSDWQACVDQAVLTPEVVGALYSMEPARIQVHNFEPALAIKVAFEREIPAGSPGDRDIFSGQQFTPVLGVTFDRPE